MTKMPSTRRRSRGAGGSRCWPSGVLTLISSRSIPAFCSTDSTPDSTVLKYQRAMYGVITAMLPVRPLASREALGEIT